MTYIRLFYLLFSFSCMARLALASDVVMVPGAQTITGDKTFSGTLNATGRFEAMSPASTYLFGTFDNNKGLIFSASTDGKRWLPVTTTYSAADASNLRDPSWIKVGGTFYVAYALASPTVTNSVRIIKSTDLVNWSTVATPSISAVASGQAWAPEWFYDEAAKQHYIIVTGVSADLSAMKLYALNPTASDFSTWSSAREVTGTSLPAKMKDGFLQKQGNTYYLFYNNNTTGYLEVATSTSRESGYTVAKSGNWSGWGNGYQGPSLVALPDGRWRLYLDAYTAVNGNKVFFAESGSSDLATATWSTLTAASNATGFVGLYEHGTVRRVTDLQVEQVLSALERDVLADKASANSARTLLGPTTQSGALRFSSSDAIINFGTAGTLNDGTVNRFRFYDDGNFVYGLTMQSFEFGFCMGSGASFHFRTGATPSTSGTDVATLNSSGDFAPIGNLVLSGTGKGVTFASTAKILSGAGSPESVVAAPVGSLYLRSDGGAGTTLYVKQSGTGNTGWVGK